ncbi:hypothetical protein [Edaphobacillus lindanitolerans]|uniref:Uncharacterized protein n=1 Tax=Edaphobacillus lindanitolerans TaxID=550447 RepID=A0A1U7PN01_9BACI|nr:hypothetical protein [Edaphobacillus lindanitolerans]SIT71333.1 hypothetical protein SAMN05428946_0712 [Edaphobacillus lindanitolerans]
MEFIYLRPVYLVFIAALLVLGGTSLARSRAVNGMTVWGISALAAAVTAICLWQSGIIVDELNMAGDEVSFYLALSVWGLSVLNVWVYGRMKRG